MADKILVDIVSDIIERLGGWEISIEGHWGDKLIKGHRVGKRILIDVSETVEGEESKDDLPQTRKDIQLLADFAGTDDLSLEDYRDLNEALKRLREGRIIE